MIRQLRPFYTPEQLTAIYSQPYASSQWADHVVRVRYTAKLLREMCPDSVADLSCGDGEIVRQANVPCPVTLGDICGNWDYTGPIEQTIEQISPVDVFVLSETLEHIENPGSLLDRIRDKADRLLLTTPHGEVTDENPQHYWGWDTDGIGTLLLGTSWTRVREPELWEPNPGGYNYYTFQIWECQ